MPGDLARSRWDRDEVHQVFDTLQFRVLRERLYATVEAAEPGGRRGLRGRRARVLGAGRGRAVAGRARRATARAPASHISGIWGARHRRRHRRRRWPRPTARAAGSTRRTSTRPTSRRSAAWLADPAAPKALHDAKGPCWRSPRAAGTLRRRHQRHRARRLPGAARPAHLRPRRPGAALPAPRAAGRGGRRRTGSSPSTAATAGTTTARSRVRRAAGPRGARPGRRARHRARGARRRPRCCATSSCRWCGCWPRWSAPASPPTPTTWRDLEAQFAGAVQGRRRRGATP